MAAGSLHDALRAWDAIVAAVPTAFDARTKVADCLLRLGHTELAVAVYRAVGWYTLKAGHPLSAIVVAKILESLGAEHDDLLATLVAYYGNESEFIQPAAGGGARISPPPLSTPIPAPPSPESTEALVEGVAKRAANDGQLGISFPERLIPIPLLSVLSETAFRRVLSCLIVGRLPGGAKVITQGEPGASFFFVANGTVAVAMTEAGTERTLAHLHENAVFGEMSLLSARPRNASVEVVGEADLIEFTRDALTSIAGEIDQVGVALHNFTQERLLQNLMATNPLFRPFNRHQRRDLLRRFTSHEVSEGAAVIRQGDEGRGLFVLLSGELDVSTTVEADPTLAESEALPLAALRAGDVFGEMSLINAGPTTATVTAATAATVLFLGRETVTKMVEGVPAVREYLANLSADRQLDNQLSLSTGDIDIDTTIMI